MFSFLRMDKSIAAVLLTVLLLTGCGGAEERKAKYQERAIAYFEDFVRPTKTYRAPSDSERTALEALSARLSDLPVDASAEEIQTVVYEIGKAHDFEPLRAWFTALYEVLLGQSQGPRFGGFVALYGIEETRQLIADGLAGKLA